MSNDIDSQGRQHIDANRARAGVPAKTRYVLATSLFLVIVVFALIYFLT